MNPSLPWTSSLFRRPAWLVSLLLPVIPALASRGWSGAPSMGGLLWGLALLGLGLSIVFGLGLGSERLGPSVRKEIDLLQTPWLGSVFLCQLSLLLGPEHAELTAMLFFASCALIAAVPFGAEFDQRTLTALLSHPAPRRLWWELKHSVLALALGLHLLIFAVGSGAAGLPHSISRLGWLVGAAGLAWATTPWWTLRTRGLLAGLVLSMAAPFAMLLPATLVIEIADRHLDWVDSGRAWSFFLPIALGLVLPAIAFQLHANAIPSGNGWRRRIPGRTGWNG